MEIEIFRPVRLFVGGAVLIFVLAEAFAGSGETVTNEHVIQMLDAKLPTSLIIKTIESASCVKFDVSPESLIALKRAGAEDRLIEFVAKSAKVGIPIEAVHTPANLPEKTEAAQLALRRFQTLLVDASKAEQFDTAGMKTALISASGFGELGISVVDDPLKAEAVLTFSCAAAGIFPFTLMHQKTKVMLLTGIGQGPSSNDPSTSDLAKRIVEELKLFRSSSLTTNSIAVPSSKAPPAIASSAAPRFLFGIKPGTKITLVSMNGLVHTGKMAMSSNPNRLSLDTPSRLDLPLTDVSILRAADTFGSFRTVYAPWSNVARLAQGTPVKAVRTDGSSVTGVLAEVTDSGVVIRAGQKLMSVPRNSIQKLRVLVKSQSQMGARIGGTVLATAGLLAILTLASAAASKGINPSGMEGLLELPAAGGTAAGGAIGHMFDTYQTIYIRLLK